MINKVFKKYNFLYNYFNSLLKSDKRFPQSIVFEGLSTISQYFFTLELARILNCTGTKDEDCSCTNCKWIKENKHPSIISINPLELIDDETKQTIPVSQIEKVTSRIRETSDYHRFFIFSGAKNSTLTPNEKEQIKEFQNAGFSYDKEDFILTPLNRKIFQEEASNALLKSTEEAPDKVTFVFLTDSKENIIQTILSRSFIFKMPYKYSGMTSIITDEFFNYYPYIPLDKIENLISYFMEINKEYEMEDILTSLQENLLTKTNKNIENLEFYKKDIKTIQNAKDMIRAKVSTKCALEFLLLSFSKEGRNL